MSAQLLIQSEITRLLQEHDLGTPEISPTSDLISLGLTSLMFAELLIVLEDELGVDPFQHDVSIVEMHTVADLVQAYDDAAVGVAP